MHNIEGNCSGSTNPISKFIKISETKYFKDLEAGIGSFYKTRL